jgi:site-specific DNA recombinase
LSERRVELASPEVVAEYVSDLRNLLNESSLPERRAFIRSFIKEVKVVGDDVVLTYTMPLPPTGLSEEKAGVLSTVHYSGR